MIPIPLGLLSAKGVPWRARPFITPTAWHHSSWGRRGVPDRSTRQRRCLIHQGVVAHGVPRSGFIIQPGVVRRRRTTPGSDAVQAIYAEGVAQIVAPGIMDRPRRIALRPGCGMWPVNARGTREYLDLTRLAEQAREEKNLKVARNKMQNCWNPIVELADSALTHTTFSPVLPP